MCFSPQADLVVGAAAAAAGVDALRHVTEPRQIPLAALPVLFGAHQITETFVWWGLSGDVSATVERVATWLYLFVALAVVPFYVPLAVGLVERSAARRWVIGVCAAAGLAVAVALGVAVVRGPISAVVGDHHLSYNVVDLHSGGQWTALYVAAACGALLASSYRDIATIGALNLVVTPVLVWMTASGFISLWCFWAAIVSILIARHMRRTHRRVLAVAATRVRLSA